VFHRSPPGGRQREGPGWRPPPPVCWRAGSLELAEGSPSPPRVRSP